MMRRGSTRRWSVIMLGLICCLAGRTAGSAIPMWEFLTRDEKISHLYGIFGKQVARYCSDSALPDCNKNLLVNGIRSLANMDDNELEQIDPYKRDAKVTIWRAMVAGEKRPMKFTKFGHEYPYYTADPLAVSVSDDNDLGEESAAINDYVRSSPHDPYLVGPMVIRVFPDGRPVPGDSQRPLPRDEDADELKYPRIPSVAEIEASGERFFYKRPSYDDATGKKRNIYAYPKTGQRSTLVSTIKNYRYRRVNPLFREPRLSDEISADSRLIRFY